MSLSESLGQSSPPEWCCKERSCPGHLTVSFRHSSGLWEMQDFSHWHTSVIVISRILARHGVYFCDIGVIAPGGEGRQLLAPRGWGGKVWQVSLDAEASP